MAAAPLAGRCVGRRAALDRAAVVARRAELARTPLIVRVTAHVVVLVVLAIPVAVVFAVLHWIFG